MKSALLAVVIALGLINAASAGPLEDGIEAYGTGDYAQARSHWLKLENDKSSDGYWAKYYLGLLHEIGLGVPIDRVKARAYYEVTYAQVSRHIMQDEARQKANEALPIDAVYRMAMIDVGRSLDMETSDDKKERRMASSVMQNARIAFDIAGFYRHAKSFFQVGILELNGTGKNFLRNKESAWAHFVLAAELGLREAENMAADLSARFNHSQQREADETLESYRKYIRPPY